MTRQKAEELEKELHKLIKVARPKLIHEVQEHAKLGDFSENAAYQIAKGKLRGLNTRILTLENLLNKAIIIESGSSDGIVSLGSKVTVQVNEQKITYQILGSQETNPTKGVISHLSPIGAALLGHKQGDEVEVEINDQIIKYKILKIE